MDRAQKIITYTSIPVCVALLAVLSEYSGFDLWLESHFYDVATGSWPYKSLFITSSILHTGGRSMVVLCAIINLLAIIASFFNQKLAPYRKHLVFIFIAAAAGPSIVSYLKGATHIYSPWDLLYFGGDKPYIRIFDTVAPGAEVGLGFPGGHSSAGFAYISTYFALAAMGHEYRYYKYRYYGITIPVLLGGLFSGTQLIRGAHFLSHDLFSFVICWSVSFLLSLIFYPSYYRQTGRHNRQANL